MKSFQSVDSRHTHIQINCRCLHVDVHIWICLIHFELETDLFVGGGGTLCFVKEKSVVIRLNGSKEEQMEQFFRRAH